MLSDAGQGKTGDTFKLLVNVKINSQQPQQVWKVEREILLFCVQAKHVYQFMMTLSLLIGAYDGCPWFLVR